MSHNAEPWTPGEIPRPNAKLNGHRLVVHSDDGSTVAEFYLEEDRARSMDCVNALAGVKDPQALRDALDDLRCCGLDDSRIATAVRRIRDLMKGS